MTSSSAGEVANGAVEPSGELRFLALLGLPAFGLALSSTVVSTYLPVIIERLSGPALTGLLIGGEGLVGLFLPSLVGTMVGGGVLLGVWQPLPFVVAAGGLAAMTAVVFVTLPRHADGGGPRSGHGVARASDGWRLLRERGDIRRFLVGNTLWEFTVAALKTFVVLFFTVGLGRSLGFTIVVLATVAGTAILAAPASGWVGDRFGRRKVIEGALLMFAAGLLLPFLTVSTWAFAGVFPVAFAAMAVMTLPYSVLMDLMADEDHGAVAGLFGLSRGIGTLLGPLITGIAIELLQGVPFFARTEGYIALFAITSAALRLSVPFVRSLRGCHDLELSHPKLGEGTAPAPRCGEPTPERCSRHGRTAVARRGSGPALESGHLVGIGLVERLAVEQGAREGLQRAAVLTQGLERALVALVDDPSRLGVHQFARGLRGPAAGSRKERHGVGARLDHPEDRVPGLVVGDALALLGRDRDATLGAEHDLLHRLGEVPGHHRCPTARRGEPRRLVHQVAQVRAHHAGRARGHRAEVDVVAQGHAPGVHVEDLPPARLVGAD